MIFVWSSNGGPLLQGVSLFLLVLQFAPHLLANKGFWLTRTIVAAVVGGAMLAYGLYRHCRPGATTSIQRIQNALRQEFRALGDFLTGGGGGGATTTVIISAAIAIAAAVMTSLALYADEGQFVSLALTAVQMIGMVLFFHRAMTQILQQQQQQQQNDNQNDNNPQDRIHEIVNLVLKLPIEEFVPQEQMASCKVSQLQEMLSIRSSSDSNATTTAFVEKNDLVAAVAKIRNYNDTCCICYEEYQAGDPLRVLPHCRHEFHVECLDQWAYTFANNRRQGGRRQPTCPLCNTAL